MPTRSSGFFIQSNYGTNGDFQLVIPHSALGLAHFARNNNNGSWSRQRYFGAPDAFSSACLIQGLPYDGLNVVARRGDKLVHYYSHSWPTGLSYCERQGEFGSELTGNPALIQSRWQGNEYFHVLAPKIAGGIAHFWKAAGTSGAWNRASDLAAGLQVAAIALIQSNFGSQGNLEAVVRVGADLLHFWSDPDAAAASRWNRSSNSPFFSGARGQPGFIQSNFGTKGNFEVVTPIEGGGMRHIWRDNDRGNLPWTATPKFGINTALEVSLVQASLGSSAGNLEVVARTGPECFEHYWRSSQWTGPTATICLQRTLQVLMPQPFVDIDFTREELQLDSNDRMVIKIVFNKAVNPDTVVFRNTLRLKTPKDPSPEIAPLQWSADRRVLTITTVKGITELAEPDQQGTPPSASRIRLELDGTFPTMVMPNRLYVVSSADATAETLDGNQDGTAGGDFWVQFYWYVPG